MSSIQTVHLAKRFGTFAAVDDVSLDIPPGQIYALIGPNGAGKTTLVKMLVGLLRPTRGTAQIAGFDINNRPLAAKRNFGYIPDEPSGYDYLTGMEYLAFTARLRNMEAPEIKARTDELVKMFPLSDIIDHPMGEYSRGNKQKVAFLAALLTKPRVIVIDEPIVGLDPPSIKIFGNQLITYAKLGNTVFFVTHMLEFAGDYAHKVGVMKKGKITRELMLSKSTKLDSLL